MATVVVATAVGCGPPGAGDDDGGSADAAPGVDATVDPGCPPGAAGTACVIALAETAVAACDAETVDRLEAELAARRGWLPLWHGGRAVFASDGAADVAGSFAGWTPLALAPVCGRALHLAILDVPSGHHQYKLISGGVWRLDPWNLAFAYDDFPGNSDGRNSVVATPDAGVGQLIAFPAPICSDELGNCRAVTAYLPRGYGDPASAARRYPVIYMHDGQNVFDDHDCCFGHTGWEVNVALDTGVASGALAEVIVVAADHAGAARSDEYGFALAAGGRMETFMAFQVGTLQPAAEAVLRIDPARRFVAGSSLGGLVSMRLALAHPAVYAGAASLSGTFWAGEGTGTALADVLAAVGKLPVAFYVDHGGSAASGSDNYDSNVAIRDQLVQLGWQRATSPVCVRSPDALCYHHEPGATHDELAWRDRAWRFLTFFAAD